MRTINRRKSVFRIESVRFLSVESMNSHFANGATFNSPFGMETARFFPSGQGPVPLFYSQIQEN
jgi:hypothetical protein